MRTRKRKTTNNKGFSLLELLVSVVILAIVIVPIMHSFITAAATNAKAKKVMEATSTAQNIVEAVKVETTSPDEDAAYTKDGDDYVKYLNEGVNGRTFYEEVRLTPRDSSKIDLAEISSMDSATAATYSVSASEVMLKRASYKIDPTGVDKGYLGREIQVTIKQDAVGSPVTVSTQLVYHYDHDGLNKTVNMYDNPYTIYSGAELKDVYIFFDPMNNYAQESITINNQNNYPVNVYLIRQGSDSCKVTLNVNELTHSDVVTNVITNMSTTVAGGELTVKLETTQAPTKSLTGTAGLTAVGLVERNEEETKKEWLNILDSTMIYDVEVKVYEKDGGKLLTTLTGTKM